MKKLGLWQLLLIALIVIGSVALPAIFLNTLIPFYIVCSIVLLEVLYIAFKAIWEHI